MTDHTIVDHNIFEFQIENEAGTCVGEIINTAPATNYEFKIEFPEQIDVRTKALLMGATMLAVNKVSFMIYRISLNNVRGH